MNDEQNIMLFLPAVLPRILAGQPPCKSCGHGITFGKTGSKLNTTWGKRQKLPMSK